eukprot:1420479-Prymnesium_polylepis.1
MSCDTVLTWSTLELASCCRTCPSAQRTLVYVFDTPFPKNLPKPDCFVGWGATLPNPSYDSLSHWRWRARATRSRKAASPSSSLESDASRIWGRHSFSSSSHNQPSIGSSPISIANHAASASSLGPTLIAFSRVASSPKSSITGQPT